MQVVPRTRAEADGHVDRVAVEVGVAQRRLDFQLDTGMDAL